MREVGFENMILTELTEGNRGRRKNQETYLTGKWMEEQGFGVDSNRTDTD